MDERAGKMMCRWRAGWILAARLWCGTGRASGTRTANKLPARVSC